MISFLILPMKELIRGDGSLERDVFRGSYKGEVNGHFRMRQWQTYDIDSTAAKMVDGKR